MCVCVCGGGGGGGSSDSLSEIPGGSNICYPGGGGVKPFSKGAESNC